MTKLRFEKFDDQAYHIYLGLDGPIGTVQKMDNYWQARIRSVRGHFSSRGEAAEWLRKEHQKS